MGEYKLHFILKVPRLSVCPVKPLICFLYSVFQELPLGFPQQSPGGSAGQGLECLIQGQSRQVAGLQTPHPSSVHPSTCLGPGVVGPSVCVSRSVSGVPKATAGRRG